MTASPMRRIPPTVLLSRLNKIYGIPGKVDPRQVYHGNVGFIID